MTIFNHQPMLPLNDLQQAAYFHSRQRRASIQDPSRTLSRTHQYGIPTATIPLAAFPIRNREITFKTKLRITGAAIGLIFEFGSSAHGIAMALSNNAIFFTAGSGVAAHDDSALATFTLAAGNWPATRILNIVGSVRPGSGSLSLWINGTLAARAQSVNTVFTNGEWSAAADGSFAAVPNGTVNLNIPVGSRVIPTNFELIEPLNVFVGQAPRTFL